MVKGIASLQSLAGPYLDPECVTFLCVYGCVCCVCLWAGDEGRKQNCGTNKPASPLL